MAHKSRLTINFMKRKMKEYDELKKRNRKRKIIIHAINYKFTSYIIKQIKKKAIVILVIILITTILEVLGIGLVIPFFIIIFEGNDFSENGILHTLLKNFQKMN